VILRDIDDAGVERAHERIEGSLQRGVRGGKLDEDDAAAIRDRIALTTEIARVADADLVVEAVPEDERLKLEVIAAIARPSPSARSSPPTPPRSRSLSSPMW